MHYPKNNVQKYYLVWCVINLSKPNCTTKWESNISDNNIWPTDLILPSCNYHMDQLMLTTSNDPIWPDVDPCNDPIWPDVDPPLCTRTCTLSSLVPPCWVVWTMAWSCLTLREKSVIHWITVIPWGTVYLLHDWGIIPTNNIDIILTHHFKQEGKTTDFKRQTWLLDFVSCVNFDTN